MPSAAAYDLPRPAAGGKIVVRTSELRAREVVNIVDGKRLGAINDVELDLATGRVIALIVPGGGRFFGLFGRDEEYIIPWDRIRKIGADVILVEVKAFTDLEGPPVA
jgi:YlmC/YmxH family sporulation protein